MSSMPKIKNPSQTLVFVPYGGGTYYGQNDFQKAVESEEVPWKLFAGAYTIIWRPSYGAC